MKIPRATKISLSKNQLQDILKIYQSSINDMPNSKQEKEFWNKVSNMPDKEDQIYMIWERFKRDAHTPGIQEYKKKSGIYMAEVEKTKAEPITSVFNKIAETIFDPLRLWKSQKEKAEIKKGPQPVR